MKTFPWEVVVLGALLAVNRLVVPATFFHPAVFWAFQAINVALALLVGILGLPGVEEYPVVGWMVAGLLAFHVFQNVALRSAALARREREELERERIRKLRSMGEEPAAGPPSEPPTP